MDFLSLKALGFIQLSILLLSSFNVLAYETESSHPPAEAPQHHKGDHRHHHHKHPPTLPPAHPPTLPPKHAPKLVAVQGVVYCKACKHARIDNLSGATPLLGAVVRLQCKNTKYTLVTETKTDKKGYFFINAPKTITTHESHECKVFLVSSPLATCNKPTNLHHGVEGAILLHASKPPVSSERPPRAYDVFTVGPFAFEPSSKRLCPR